LSIDANGNSGLFLFPEVNIFQFEDQWMMISHEMKYRAVGGHMIKSHWSTDGATSLQALPDSDTVERSTNSWNNLNGVDKRQRTYLRESDHSIEHLM
jgi:hypothetical protein